MPRTIIEKQDVISKLGDIFRRFGYFGASLSEITQQTGLGKGSLYHFFPNGKQEMADTVLDEVSIWFETNIFMPLRTNQNASNSIKKMFTEVDKFFYSGERICLMGAFALDNTRSLFSKKLNTYFTSWINALASAIKKSGCSTKRANQLSEEIVAGIQGSLVLARAQNNPRIFSRNMKRLEKRITSILDEK